MRFSARLGLALAAGLAAIASAKPAAQPPITAGHLAPRDECGALPKATAFRAALAAAIRRRDAAALTGMAASDIVVSFGGDNGPAALRGALRGADGPALWRELDQLLGLGCAVQDGAMVLPWFFAQDLGEDEAYDRYLVAGAQVPLRDAASPDGKVIRLLSWVLVRRLDPASEQPRRFERVRLDGGPVTGYVESARLRSQLDHRLGARREAKGWKIAFFTAGD